MDITRLTLPGETLTQTARRLGVPLNTLRGWRHSAPSQKYRQLIPALQTTAPKQTGATRQDQNWLTTTQAANRLGLSRTTIRTLIRRGELPCLSYQTPSGRTTYRIPEKSLHNFLEAV